MHKKELAKAKVRPEDYAKLAKAVSGKPKWQYAGLAKEGKGFILPEGILRVSRKPEEGLQHLSKPLHLIPYILYIPTGAEHPVLQINRLWLKGKLLQIASFKPEPEEKHRAIGLWLWNAEKVLQEIRAFLSYAPLDCSRKKAINKKVLEAFSIYLAKHCRLSKRETYNNIAKLAPLLFRCR